MRRRRLGRRLLARLCILFAIGFVILELAGPRLNRWGGAGRKDGAAALLLDLSGSMEVRGLKAGADVPNEENLTGTRLALAKSISLELLETLPERNIALIAFARRAFMVSPVTKSKSSLKERIESLEVLEYEDGTAISDALVCACCTLEQVPPSATRRIYLVSDGADHSDAESRKEAVAMLRKAGIAVYPIIVGGDYLYHPVRETSGNLIWQANGEKADIGAIEKLAAETDGHILALNEIAGVGECEGKASGGKGVCLFVAVFFLVLAGLLELGSFLDKFSCKIVKQD